MLWYGKRLPNRTAILVDKLRFFAHEVLNFYEQETSTNYLTLEGSIMLHPRCYFYNCFTLEESVRE